MVDAALAVAEPCMVAGLRTERPAAAPAGDDLLAVVNTELGAVLGEAPPPDQSFQELGLDWPATVRLRTRLCVATGLDLPTTVLTDHPTPAALVAHLLGLLGVAPKPVARQRKPVRHLPRVPMIAPAPSSPTVPWLLSATSPVALRDEARWLAAIAPDLDIFEVGLALTARPALPYRAAVTGTTHAELIAGLAAATPSVVDTAPMAFLFAGQGAQRVGMGAELSTRFPVFRQAFTEVCETVNPHLPTPLNDVLHTNALHGTEFAQPAAFAIEVALFRLLESWGVRPDYVAGHSVGEFAAAHVAGVLSLSDAALLVAARGRLTQALPDGGTMVSVQATEAEVAPLLSPSMAIAAINGPTALVLSGETSATLAAAEELADRGRKTRRLAVSHALHSPLMTPMLPRFETIAEPIPHSPARIPMISTLTGNETPLTPAYWATQAHSTVRFADAMAELASRGVETFVELGPDAVLTRMTRDCLPHATAIPTMTRKHPETRTIAEAFGHLFTRGSTMDGQTLFPGTAHVVLPTRLPHRRSA
jgi:acyl transferase domain-containing protein